jgi:uncharacterized protein YjbI with pentapeptide repeats
MRFKRLPVLILIAAAWLSIAQDTNPAKTIAVLDFETIDCDISMGKKIAEIARLEIAGLKDYTLISREHLTAVLKEHELALTGCTENSCALEIGKVISAEKIITGRVMQAGNTFIFTIKYIDVGTTEMEVIGSGKFTRQKEIQESVRKAVFDMAQKLSGTKNIAADADTLKNFKNANLDAVDFSGLRLHNSDFSNANLNKANFTGCAMHNCKFLNANMNEARLCGADCANADFTHANMNAVDLSETNLSQAQFKSANLNAAKINKKWRELILKSGADNIPQILWQ